MYKVVFIYKVSRCWDSFFLLGNTGTLSMSACTDKKCSNTTISILKCKGSSLYITNVIYTVLISLNMRLKTRAHRILKDRRGEKEQAETYNKPGYIIEHSMVQKTLSECTWRALPLGSCRILCAGCSWLAESGSWTRSQESLWPCLSWQTLIEHCISRGRPERGRVTCYENWIEILTDLF